MQYSSDPESKMHLANEWNVGVESIFLFKHEEKTKQFIVLVLGVSDICINSGSRCACCSFAADKSYAAIIRHAAEKFSFHFNFILKSSYHWIWRVFVTYLFRNLFLRLMLFSCCGLFIFCLLQSIRNMNKVARSKWFDSIVCSDWWIICLSIYLGHQSGARLK